jgi:hypothetical protein
VKLIFNAKRNKMLVYDELKRGQEVWIVLAFERELYFGYFCEL